MTGTVDGLASNIKTKDGKQATAKDVKDNKFTSNNSFYVLDIVNQNKKQNLIQKKLL